ncbi:MAG: acetylglutamate kinase [Acidobacteriota bacterium]|nr:acetylglutamate kinase [Acidobacteriota bacterium]
MRLLIKVGGTLLDEAGSQTALARELASLSGEHQLTIVHGGGKQMTRFLEERGIESHFVNGLRVSDEAVIDAASKVIAGSVNKGFVSALTAAGLPALGLSGVDGGLTTATQMSPDLGFVGRPTQSNGALLEWLLGGGYVPVVACIAGDSGGTIYNVNADQMAVSCAIAFRADKLIFLTDVSGVKNALGDVMRYLTDLDVKELIESDIAHGGMQAKLEAAVTALSGGIKEVVIASGQQANICTALLAGEPVGTKLSLCSVAGVRR